MLPMALHLMLSRIPKLPIALSICLVAASCFQIGAGGSNQVAPDSIRASEPAVIKLELLVWGEGGPIKGRYTDVTCHYRLSGEQTHAILVSVPSPQDDKHEVYEFTIPGYPAGTTGDIEYYFEMKLDGQPSRIDGIKKIHLL
jgi:hypothetical protein